MMPKEFQELCKFYQSTILNLFEEELKKRGLEITKRTYEDNITKDIAGLEVEISDGKEKGRFRFGNSWRDFLCIDSDEIPPRIDPMIIDRRYGINKASRIVSERIEILDAARKQENEKLRLLGKYMGRIRVREPLKDGSSEEKVTFHYEGGVKLKDKLGTN